LEDGGPIELGVVTCRLDERVGEVRARIDASPYGFGLVTSAGGVLAKLAARDLEGAIVTTPAGVLVGVIRRRELEAALTHDPGRPATA